MDNSTEDKKTGSLLAVILLIVSIVIFFYYGMPALRDRTLNRPRLTVPGR